MVPMTIDTVVPGAATLLVVAPAFFGVMMALVAAVAVAIAGTHRELTRLETGRPDRVRSAVRPVPARLAA